MPDRWPTQEERLRMTDDELRLAEAEHEARRGFAKAREMAAEADRLRATLERWKASHGEECGRLRAELESAEQVIDQLRADLIEGLKQRDQARAERDEARRQLTDCAERERAWAIERIREARLGRHNSKKRWKAEAERDRYREALRQIAEGGEWPTFPEFAVKTARAALEGSDDG